jgi:PST family polysaccharide transporter
MKLSSNKVLYQNTFMLYLMTIAKYAFPLIVFPYLTRVLMPEYFGVVIFMTATMSYFSYVIDFGFNFSATRKIARNQDNVAEIEKTFSNVIAAKCLLAIIGGVILAAIIPFIAILHQNVLLTVLYYLATASNLLIPDFLYRGLEKMQFVTMRYVITKTISTALIFVFVHDPQDILWIPILNIIGTLVAVALTLHHITKKLDIHLVKTSRDAVFTSLKESSVFFIATFASTAFTATNIFVMGIVNLSTIDIAYWGVAIQIISIIMSLYDPITSSVYPRMMVTRDFKLVKKLLLVIQPIIVVGIIFSYVVSPFAIGLLAGNGYEEAVPVFRTLLPVLFFAFPAQMLGFPVLGVIGKEMLATKATLYAAVFHVTGLVVLCAVNQFGLIQIAILRSCTECILCFVRVFFVLREQKTVQTVKK